MRRIALGIEYCGEGYYGWQVQHNLPTIQGLLQDALSKVANEPIYLHCAGRTDANVHATSQVVHFDTNAKRHIDAWIWGANRYLPASIVVKWAKQVDFTFHARFSAKARRYRYVILNQPIRPAVLAGRTTWHYYPLDVDTMRTASQFFLGEQDFSSFRSSQCGSKTPMRCVTEIHITERSPFIFVEIEANAFLHHMVRNIMGVLLKIAEGHKPPVWASEVLAARNRKLAAETAPPDGLYLIQVRYPEQYELPTHPSFFLL